MLTILLLAALFQTREPGANTRPERLGSLTLPRVATFAPARGGMCIGVATESRAIAVDMTGKTLWQAALFEPVASLDKIAIARSCEWLAIAGLESARIQIVDRDGFRLVVPLVPPEADEAERRTWSARSIDISSDGQWLVVGTEYARIAVVTRRGVVTKQMVVSELGNPVVVEFAPESTRLLVTAYYAVGVVRLNGEWVWRREVRPANILANTDYTSFAGRFVTSHGTPNGTVEMLDARGKTRWIRDNIWDPAIAVAPNGSWMAFTGSAVGFETGYPVSNGPTQAWLVDRAGRTVRRVTVDGQLDHISPDGRCLVLREPSSAAFVGRDLRFREAWRLDVPHLSDIMFAASSNVVAVRNDEVLETYRLPTCRAVGTTAGRR